MFRVLEVIISRAHAPGMLVLHSQYGITKILFVALALSLALALALSPSPSTPIAPLCPPFLCLECSSFVQYVFLFSLFHVCTSTRLLVCMFARLHEGTEFLSCLQQPRLQQRR